ncbi:enoyl-CoA hydratase/isomerase family protein [Flavobacterium sp. RHBU_24]|uniref:enoyl-CoA hydratase/isomerase family protein n=1 Tax=Flavobacterium sp. RHBU_24 TaxID=3391185 RepID=UPI0039850D52
MEPFVKTQIDNGIATIAFFHPQGNAMPGIQLARLAADITSAGADADVKVIILKSGGDRAFCAGASFDELLSIANEEDGKAFFLGFANVINAMRKVPKLIMARIQGKAVGGGVGLACAADYTLATTAAAIKLSELTIGIGPFVISPAVERKIGTSAFMHLTMNATEFYDAQWAKDKNLYADTFETVEALDDAVATLAQKLATYNPEAMKLLKQAAWAGTEHWDTLLTERAQMSGSLVLSDFTKNALHNFNPK